MPTALNAVIGVFPKATQGQSNVDQTDAAHRKAAVAAGLLWGAYHFVTGSDGGRHAEHFLKVAEPDDSLPARLRAEPDRTQHGLEEARAFVTHVEAQQGKFPGLYSGHCIKQLLGNGSDSTLTQCWLGLAQFGPTPVVSRNWTLWQYTDGSLGPAPHDVNGAGFCDRDKFNGDAARLKRLWLN